MASKMYEIAFKIGASVAGSFSSAFMSAADKMSALEAKDFGLVDEVMDRRPTPADSELKAA